MAYLEFNKEELVNLEYSLEREILLSNRAGGYINTTIVGCNTRKYHGLLVVPIKNFGMEKHILLSTLHESLIQHGKSFNLGISSYGDVYEPRGHKYIIDFEMDYASTITYRVGGMKFSKTITFVRDSEEVLIKYTLLEAHSQTLLRIKPFLAFRNIHALTYANTEANTRYNVIDNGVAFNMYTGFPTLHLQLNKKNDWIACPDWYHNVVYKEELRRGFACNEDLFVPGYFEVPIKTGESIILSASTSLVQSKVLKHRFDKELLKKEGTRSSYDACLKLAAKQFVIKQDNEYSICSGYSWDYENLRQSFVALPGLTIYNDSDAPRFEKILDSIIKQHKEDLTKPSNSPDTPLWLFKTLQQYIDWGADEHEVWKKYGKILKEIVDSYTNGSRSEITIHENGLIWAQKDGVALTWMNTYTNGKPVCERAGYQVEVNALWYNALCFIATMDEKYGKKKYTEMLNPIIAKIKDNFYNVFWVEARLHLADYVNDDEKNLFTRPNQLIACAVKYSPLDDMAKMQVFRAVTKELLTQRGIRTLSPKNPLYKGIYEGNQEDRDIAHFNGCAFPALLGAYVDVDIMLNGKSAVKKCTELLNAFEEDINIHGIGSIAEIYDGDPSHRPHGCISSAVGVAEIIRGKSLLNRIK
ncbi:MAG: glycogen debranching enzyme N-terminal domain-containing protein [Bacteroidales bacterium]